MSLGIIYFSDKEEHGLALLALVNSFNLQILEAPDVFHWRWSHSVTCSRTALRFHFLKDEVRS
ncbi:hypothetical protein OUZ56_004219 [Daphnia magna]|uniref:Uncharacterized protein n=1 Tax=Daphnia magna TaxID=35525 RepID=A0ABQ9YP40_9CRUS|nr:hypothetical protein OUZ56_004219 [Daphnia magna]